MTEEIDLRVYWHILLKWWWLLLLAVTAGGVAAFLVTGTMTPLYQSTTKVLVQRGATPGTPSLSDIQASEQLAQNYGDLLKTRPILDLVIQDLSLPYGPGTLFSKIKVTSPRSLIEITVSDPDPQLAADIANTTAQTFINDFRDKQFLQIAQFQTSLGQYGITQDPAIIAAQATTMSTLLIAEPAIPSSAPYSPRTGRNIFLAAMLGLLGATVVVFILEYLDDRVKSPDELKTITGLPTLGSVLRYQTRDGLAPVTLGDEHLHSSMAESYNFLRTNLQFAALGTQGLNALLVTSSSPEEGKTTTAANLAISISKDGKKVVLVDTDLRKPALHRIFDLQDHKGLTNVILGDTTLEEALAPTPVEGLRVIPSGPLPPDATHVLGSAKMKEVVEQIKSTADLVIFDSPPLLAVTDPMLLVSLVDGAILVVDAERARRDSVRRSTEILLQASPAFVGAVLNKVHGRGRGGSYYYYYQAYNSSRNNGKDEGHNRVKRSGVLQSLFRKGKKLSRSARRRQV